MERGRATRRRHPTRSAPSVRDGDTIAAMVARIPDRVRWAVDLVAPPADARVLEVGCGPGAAAELVCERLTGGTMLAIDRSPIAVARTEKRNTRDIEEGRLLVAHSALADLAVDAGAFDVVLAINVNIFWTTPARAELDVLGHALAPGGRLAILYGPGPESSTKAAAHPDGDRLDVIAGAVERSGFPDVRVVRERGGCGVIAVRGAEHPP